MSVITSKSSNRLLPSFLQYRSIKTIGKVDGIIHKHFKVGDKVEVDKTITDRDLDVFTEISGDVNPLHINEPKIFHGAYLNMLVSYVMGTRLPGPGSLVVKQKMRFPHPCYVNQTVTVTVEVAEVKRLVTCNYTIFSHQQKVTIMEGDAQLLIRNVYSKM
ncbi:hydroxyacyl-thioester dehydratase type 2, mitochondrial-like [Lycorma delicatula]|uniref:hydroxyacyl-thioester dehydratase type 2, mitochondrial-like n=1 Tax=Lycorma delicatula TaxID=130591 RepID=UPI003F5149A9